MQAVNGVNGVNKGSESSWKVGLVNYDNKYLTAESFGFKINVSGTALKKKQIFTLVQDPQDTEAVYIRSHLGYYVSSDKYGNVSCDTEERGQTEKFKVDYDKEFSGCWAFRHVVYGYYLGGTRDNLKCFQKIITAQELWTVQLSIHPQIHLRNVNRKRYAHVYDDQLQVTQTIPWAAKSLLFLVYEKGRYSLKTFDDRYLLNSGDLSQQKTQDAEFTLEIRSGQNGGLAFRDRNGCYLTGVGSTAQMKSRNRMVTKDELFTLEDTHPQMVLYACNNGKKVSIKQGVDVSANQEGEEDSDKEIFQMEFQTARGKWAFRTVDNKYWEERDGGIQANRNDISKCDEALFDLEWQEDGTAALRAHNNLYVYNKPTGSLVAGSEAVGPKEKFKIRIANRPMLVLKSDHGFVGCRPTSGEVVCNKAQYDIIHLHDVPGKPGVYYFQAARDKYWSVSDDTSVVTDGSNKSEFQIQVRDNRKMTIRALSNNCFLKGEQNGLFRANGQQLDTSVLWEY